MDAAYGRCDCTASGKTVLRLVINLNEQQLKAPPWYNTLLLHGILPFRRPLRVPVILSIEQT